MVFLNQRLLNNLFCVYILYYICLRWVWHCCLATNEFWWNFVGWLIFLCSYIVLRFNTTANVTILEHFRSFTGTDAKKTLFNVIHSSFEDSDVLTCKVDFAWNIGMQHRCWIEMKFKFISQCITLVRPLLKSIENGNFRPPGAPKPLNQLS